VFDADDGIVVHLRSRLGRHNNGRGCAFTANRLPVALVHAEEYATRADALRRERQLERWTRAKKETLIAGDCALLRGCRRWRTLRLAATIDPIAAPLVTALYRSSRNPECEQALIFREAATSYENAARSHSSGQAGA
jgi:putative endonuclease